MSLKVERLRLQGPALCSALLEDFQSVADYYVAGPANELGSYLRVAQRIRDEYPESRWTALRAALPQADDSLTARLEDLIAQRGLFVSTGQQAGLFLGPLFTVYKALTAVRLASQLEEQLDVPVIPLFSIASEDHDWEEVAHTFIVDLQNQLVRLSVQGPGPDDPHPPVERVRVGADIEQALAKLVQCTPNTEFKVAVLTALREAYRPGRSFPEAFQVALGHVLRRLTVFLVRTAHPYVKQVTREVLWAEWEKREESEARLLERTEALKAAGFEAQVAVVQGATNIFLEGRMGRERLLWDDTGARLRRSGDRITEEELRLVLEDAPQRVSAGALLRPVTEARAFPVVAYVGGPGEIAYLAQSQVLFELHRIPAPVVVPRAAFQLIEAKISRVLEKYGLELDDLAGDAGQVINRLLNEQTPLELRRSLEALRGSVAATLRQVESAALDFDPGSKSALGSGAKAILESIEALEAKLEARVRDKHGVMRQQLEKAATNLYPSGRLQERVLNLYPYLVRYGESLLDELYSSVVTPLD